MSNLHTKYYFDDNFTQSDFIEYSNEIREKIFDKSLEQNMTSEEFIENCSEAELNECLE